MKKRPKVQGSEKWGVKCSEVQWSEVKIFGEMWVLSSIYSCVALCRLCAVYCVNIASLFSFLITRLTFLILFLCLFSRFMCLFSIFCILCFCIASCIVSPCGYRCLFINFLKVYWPLPPGGIPTAVNKCHNQVLVTALHLTHVAVPITLGGRVASTTRKRQTRPIWSHYLSILALGM